MPRRKKHKGSDMSKKHKRNRSNGRGKWHRQPRGGKTYAERLGKEMRIKELETEIAGLEKKMGKRWNPVPYLGSIAFTNWWRENVDTPQS